MQAHCSVLVIPHNQLCSWALHDLVVPDEQGLVRMRSSSSSFAFPAARTSFNYLAFRLTLSTKSATFCRWAEDKVYATG